MGIPGEPSSPLPCTADFFILAVFCFAFIPAVAALPWRLHPTSPLRRLKR
jgi:hypothetical protein